MAQQPTLTQTLGYSYVPTLLMSSPPWLFSAIVSLINAWHADKTQERVSDKILRPRNIGMKLTRRSSGTLLFHFCVV